MNSNVLMQKLVFVAPVIARIILYLLMGLSVLSIGLIVERWWYFRKRRDDLDSLSDELKRMLAAGDFAAVRKLLRVSPSVEAEILAEALDWYGSGPEAVEQILVKAVRMRRKKFESGLLFLGTLGNNAPFIGLFGTVLGIVTAFRELGGSQTGGAMGNVMSGIAEALLATAIGILVAIPAVVFYNLFQKKGSEIEEHAAALGNVLIASMKGQPKANGAAKKEAAREGAIEHAVRTVEMEA